MESIWLSIEECTKLKGGWKLELGVWGGWMFPAEENMVKTIKPHPTSTAIEGQNGDFKLHVEKKKCCQ